MSLNILPGVAMPGTLSLVFLPAETAGFDKDTPSATLLNGATAIPVQCHIPTGTYTGISNDLPQIRKGRACTKEPIYVNGEKEVNVGSIQVVYDPQDLEDDLSVPYAELAPDTFWWRVERRGVQGQEDIAVGDIVDVHLVKVTHRNKPYSEEAGAEHVAEIFFAYQAEAAEDVAVVAGGGG